MVCRGAVQECVPWQCDHGVEIMDVMEVERILENCGGVSARGLVGHKLKAIVCGGCERSWAVVI